MPTLPISQDSSPSARDPSSRLPSRRSIRGRRFSLWMRQARTTPGEQASPSTSEPCWTCRRWGSPTDPYSRTDRSRRWSGVRSARSVWAGTWWPFGCARGRGRGRCWRMPDGAPAPRRRRPSCSNPRPRAPGLPSRYKRLDAWPVRRAPRKRTSSLARNTFTGTAQAKLQSTKMTVREPRNGNHGTGTTERAHGTSTARQPEQGA